MRHVLKAITSAKAIGCCVLLLLLASTVKSQRIIDDTSSILVDSVIEKRLVALAMESPTVEITEYQNKMTELQLKQARQTWLNLLTISGNYNDQTFAKKDPNSTVVYPKFFTGISIPLGMIFSRTNIKSAKAQLAVSQLSREITARSTRTQIIGLWKRYKSTGVLIRNQQQVVDDYAVALLQAEKKFADGGITIEAYNMASRTHNDEVARLVNLKTEQMMLQLEIEQMIGVPLETVLY